ncbi:ArnT family glycosyltransferase [Edaphocola flava]|uniref:ArnT family glycosyltransferase n=1 Tax=Edaphocola flava TaxID=2499629 RepID=UPI00100BFDFB|nr:glycosyltransferase family 39 protein [Edaphocola flava]
MNPGFAHFQPQGKLYRWLVLLLAIMVGIPLFACLDAVTIRKWDEGRLVANALEMYANRNFWVTYCFGVPDMWNTKPPLLIWIQVLSLQTFGLNEWAVRLPSAVASMLTCILIFRFVERQGKSFLWAALTVLILVTTRGYAGMHVARTADYDALLVLWTTIAGISLWKYCEHNSPRHLYITFISMGLAVLTKSAAGLMFGPCMLLYIVFRRQLPALFKSKHFYIGIILFLLIAVPFYLIREHYNPGYIKAVNENEWGGRYLVANEDNGQPWYYYLKHVVERMFVPWFVFVPIGLWFMRKMPATAASRVLQYSALMGIGFFIVASIAKTKLFWYIAPAYPYLSVLCAYGILKLMQALYHPVIKPVFRKAGFVLVALLFLITYVTILVDNGWRKEDAAFLNIYNTSNYVRDRFLQQDTLKQIVLHDEKCYPQMILYMRMAERKGYKVWDSRDKKIAPGDYVLTEDPEMEKELHQQYVLQKVREELGARVWLCKAVSIKPE